MEKLNIDCLEEIMKYLSFRDKLNLGATSQQNRQAFVQWIKRYCKRLFHLIRMTIEEEQQFIRIAGEYLESYVLHRKVFFELAAHCKNLNRLHLGYNFDDRIESKQEVNSLSNLQALEVFTYSSHAKISNEMMEVLVQTLAKLPKLRAVSLPCQSYEGKYLDTLTRVESLRLGQTANMSLEYFSAACENIKNLRVLHLAWAMCSSKYNADCHKLSAISQYCKNLETLVLEFVAGRFEELFNLPKLKFLVIEHSCLLNSLEVLAARKADTLKYLKLTNITADPGHVSHIGQMRALQELECELNANDVEQLTNLQQLKYFILDCIGCPKLVRFQVNSQKLSESFFAAASDVLRRHRVKGLRGDEKVELGLSSNELKKLQKFVTKNNSIDLYIHTTFSCYYRSNLLELLEDSISLKWHIS